MSQIATETVVMNITAKYLYQYMLHGSMQLIQHYPLFLCLCLYDILWYGVLWFKLQKDYKGARQQYEAVLGLEPGNKIVMENLNKLERLERSRKN